MGGGGPSESAALTQLLKFGHRFEAESRPTRQLGFQQIEQALRTGGVGARIPIIQRAVEASRRAGSEAERGVTEQLATSGVTGPFASRELGRVRRESEFATSQVAPEIINMLVKLGFPLAIAQGGQGASATAQTANLEVASQAGAAAQRSGAFGGIAQGAGGVLGAIIAAFLNSE